MTCHLRLLLQNALSGPTWKRARGVYSETRSSQTSCYWSAKSHRPDKDEPLSRQQLSRFVLRTGREHAAAKACLNRIQAPLVFTALHALEVRNAFKLGVFRGFFTAKDAASAWTNLDADLRSGRLVKTAVKWPVAFRVAAHLSERPPSVCL